MSDETQSGEPGEAGGEEEPAPAPAAEPEEPATDPEPAGDEPGDGDDGEAA